MIVKMEKPLISVIVPVYKVEKELNRCVESIVGQTYKNFELILIDDGSPDSSSNVRFLEVKRFKNQSHAYLQSRIICCEEHGHC